jgi:putative salt-induced outer membrane protein YdiY
VAIVAGMMSLARFPTALGGALGVGALLVAVPRWTAAQAPGPPPPPAPPPLLEASAQFTFLDTRGNATSQALGAGGDVTWRPALWTYQAKGIYAQNKADEVLKARSLNAQLRAARKVSGKLSAFSQYTYLKDDFAGVFHRHVIEGGGSYAAVDTRRNRLRLDAGVGYLSEKRPDETFDAATGTLGAAYKYAISATSDFTYEPDFLLPFSETDAWRFHHEAALSVAMTSILSLKVSQTLRYSAKPPPNFKKTDAIMAISLVAKMKQAR